MALQSYDMLISSPLKIKLVNILSNRLTLLCLVFMRSIIIFLLGTIQNTVVKQASKRQKTCPAESPKLSDFSIELVKAERDLCAACERKFVISDIRIMHVAYSTDLTVENFSFGCKAMWYHVPCFARSRSKIGWLESGELLPGFKRLPEECKELVKKQIP